MNKGGMGMGSALIVLVFVVLCLSIFALISLSSANYDQALAQVAARNVKGYYEADALAETIVAEILAAKTIPSEILGVEIESFMDSVMFSCPVSDNKELHVEIALAANAYSIRKWRMQDIDSWELIDIGLPVWLGE